MFYYMYIVLYVQYFNTLLCSFTCWTEGKIVESAHENKPTFLHSYAAVRSVFQDQLLDLKLSSLPQLADTILSCVWLGCREHGVGGGGVSPASPPTMESLVTSVKGPGQRQPLRCCWFPILPLSLHNPVSALIQLPSKYRTTEVRNYQKLSPLDF